MIFGKLGDFAVERVGCLGRLVGICVRDRWE